MLITITPKVFFGWDCFNLYRLVFIFIDLKALQLECFFFGGYVTEESKRIRLALPSKGRLAAETLDLMDKAGMGVHKPNPRQYLASIPSMPELEVIFQRSGDIALSVLEGSVDFGITGFDVVAERSQSIGDLLVMLDELGYGECTLNVIVPETWRGGNYMQNLREKQRELGRPLRVATKFPALTKNFFSKHGFVDVQLIQAEGALEAAPTIGYADLIADLVSTGTTLRDNRLKILEDGLILDSQACLVANRAALRGRPEVLAVAKQLLEFLVAHLRASQNVSLFANIRGESMEEVGRQVLSKEVISGLQGPTISQIVTRGEENWFAVHLIVEKYELAIAIRELREVGGSGVVVTPVNYIFEEEPEAYMKMLTQLEN